MTWIARLFIALIKLYQLTLSPLIGRSCRFEPSCSRYTSACIAEHGALRGSWLGLLRIGRCHPFHPGGYDPPPLHPGSYAAPCVHTGGCAAASVHLTVSSTAPKPAPEL